jgi:MoCo/4Fe-4S cofactor protein with predicted Tat translocation signal
MKDQHNNIWIGVQDKTNDPALEEMISQEFYELPIIDALADDKFVEESSTNRRDFLKYLGFGTGAAMLAASCEIPLKKAIPYVVKPDSIVPGVATYYASSFVKGGDYCSILVKTREGRPIKIEGNPSSPITKGGTSARVQASVLDLYNTERFKSPAIKGDDAFTKTDWVGLDKAIRAKLTATSNVRILTNTILSPTTKQSIAEFTAKYPNTKVVAYDPISSAAILRANQECFGDGAIPSYHFDKANVVVTFGADFLGSWISPIEYAADWVTTRKINTKNPKMSRLIAVENGMSMTGSNADNRILIKPSEQGAAIVTLYNAVAALAGGEVVPSKAVNATATSALKEVAKDLVANKGKSLVVSNSNDKNVQIVVNKLNDLLTNYGNTLSFEAASLQRQGDESSVQTLVNEMKSGAVDMVIVNGANPAYDLPNAEAFKTAFAKVKTRVSFAETNDETTDLCNYLAPTNNVLESWGDAEPKRGHYSLVQPTINRLFKTRQKELSLNAWAIDVYPTNFDNMSEQPMFDYLKKSWETNMFPKQTSYISFNSFWDAVLHDGVFHSAQASTATAFAGNVQAAASKIKGASTAEIEINFYETVNMGAGEYASNPWLQEMPDPVNRTVWGNYLSTNITFDGVNDYKAFKDLKQDSKGNTDLAKIEAANGASQVLAIVPTFGQLDNTVSAGLGYGRTIVSSAGKDVGTNLYPMLTYNEEGLLQYWATCEVTKQSDREREFACVQYHHTMGVTGEAEGLEGTVNVDERILGHKGYQGSLTDRSIIYHENLDNIGELLHKIEEKREEADHLNTKTLYPGYDDVYEMGHHWAMHIDLNACTGCSACTVACMAENNVPVVGKKEVYRHHEMTWLRIDRYFYGDVNNPSVVYQPMMCQHCDNAPCENVCPVAATNHSSEGLNQMTYNRCIGTRYCANNCPYKVRRFNWLDYTTADLWPANEYPINGEELPFGADNLTRMVLNPDVTVRSRGVIEKCSFCVQRIQEGKLTAKREGRKLKDNDVKTACQTACPTGAIIFGDKNDKEGKVSKAMESPLNYYVLEEINVAPSVMYTAKITNKNTKIDA